MNFNTLIEVSNVIYIEHLISFEKPTGIGVVNVNVLYKLINIFKKYSESN